MAGVVQNQHGGHEHDDRIMQHKHLADPTMACKRNNFKAIYNHRDSIEEDNARMDAMKKR